MTAYKPTRQELRAKHGTPDEFASACMAAWDMITMDEAQEAIRKYNEEWEAVPEGDDS